jgi:hypothetical protein
MLGNEDGSATSRCPSRMLPSLFATMLARLINQLMRNTWSLFDHIPQTSKRMALDKAAY